MTLTISGTLMYMLEGDEQPTVFSSIPAAMWWPIETFTTVGYGDMAPETVVGKMLGGAVSIIGIGTLALFSRLITVSFLNQSRLRREQSANHRTAVAPQTDASRLCPHCGSPIDGSARSLHAAASD